MATLYITEYSSIGDALNGKAQVAGASFIATQTVALSGSSARSTALSAQTKLVRLHTDAICSFKVGGSTVTAATTDPRMAADNTEYFGVNGGEYIAAITNT
jgi:hypothetical protein